jgi:hypothetical protein
MDKLIEAAGQLSQSELEQFVAQVLALQARRKAPNLSVEEAALLTKINSGLPAALRRRYEELISKRREERLSQVEHEELLGLTDEVEQKQAERVQSLAELARLRDMSMRDLVKALGVKQPTVA